MNFNTSLEFIQPFLSIEGLMIAGIALMAAVLVYLLSVMYAETAKKSAAKLLPSFGFKEDEANALSELASGLIKTAGIATIMMIVGNYVLGPFLDPVKDVGSFIFRLIGYMIDLALPIAVIYLARTWLKSKT
jgi:hypothetical protein